MLRVPRRPLQLQKLTDLDSLFDCEFLLSGSLEATFFSTAVTILEELGETPRAPSHD
jgi:hypothetical protein